jgi:hypothetical protein
MRWRFAKVYAPPHARDGGTSDVLPCVCRSDLRDRSRDEAPHLAKRELPFDYGHSEVCVVQVRAIPHQQSAGKATELAYSHRAHSDPPFGFIDERREPVDFVAMIGPCREFEDIRA